MITESDEITVIKGIGAKKAEAFGTLGIRTVGDLIAFLPNGYKDRGKMKVPGACVSGEKALIKAVYVKASGVAYFSGRSKVTLTFTYEGAAFNAVYFNQPYMRANLTPGQTYLLYGTVSQNKGAFEIMNAQVERCEGAAYLTEGVYPVYPLPQGCAVRQKEIALSIRKALAAVEIGEDMPFWMLCALSLRGKKEALHALHMPSSFAEAKAAAGYFKLKEFLRFRITIDRLGGKKETAQPLSAGDLNAYEKALGFDMTAAQKRCTEEIAKELKSGIRMNRLLQGDVGSGKTAVAGAAVFIAARCGSQAAFTAPTEVLAKQHYEKYRKIYASFGYESVLLCASLNRKERDTATEKIADGTARIIFGTHSIFSKNVTYKNLALIVIDEQQRYGVAQRAALEAKGDKPHVLVMSATPIPRTLCLSLYKDLSVSVIDEMPADRRGTVTCAVNSAQTPAIYNTIKRTAQQGRKSYIVCPAIDSEDMENVKETYAEAVSALSPYKVKMLTAETNPEQSARIMESFSDGDTAVLIATSVIEVGVDVPDAVVMWVKGSERFGLSQLHQLRGRIGRGAWESVCFFQTDSTSPEAAKRLSALIKTTDGFEIAKMDLALRGAGELIGRRQSGKGLDITQDAMDYETLFIASEGIYAQLLEKKDKKSESFLLSLKKASEDELKDIALN